MSLNALCFDTQCPVCGRVTQYPADLVCRQCGWQITLFTGKPGSDELKRLDELKRIRTHDFREQGRKGNEIELLHAKLDRQRNESDKLSARLKDIGNKIAQQEEQNQELDSDPVLGFNLLELEETVTNLTQKKQELTSRIPSGEYYQKKQVTLRCTYDADENCINVVVTDLQHPNPIALELFLGLAIASYPFAHYSDAEAVIPAISPDKPVKIHETGDEFRLALRQRPKQSIVHYEVIHLYALTLSKFTIE